MASKAQVLRKAEELGCEVQMTDYDIAVYAPKGKLLGQDLHISSFDWNYTSRADIWDKLWSELNAISNCEGSKYCECGE